MDRNAKLREEIEENAKKNAKKNEMLRNAKLREGIEKVEESSDCSTSLILLWVINMSSGSDASSSSSITKLIHCFSTISLS